MKKKLLILGWDAADWEVINSLMERGLMPALQRLLKKSSYGKLATMDPPISPMLWTSIATGVPPQEHGILGFVEPNAEGNGLRPLNSTSRKVKAVWNILSQCDLKCNIVGWWPSHPAEPINGVMVSNFYQMITSLEPEKWKMSQGTVHPESLSEQLSEFRVHPLEITPAHILPFIPDFFEIDHKEEKTASQLRKELAHAASIQAVSTWLMQHTEWDVMAVYYDFIDHCSHMGMRYRAPKLPNTPDDKFKHYQHLVDGAYRFQDMMLERMLDLIDENTAVMILSDHGFESGDMRPRLLPEEPAGPTHEHSPYGIFVWSGENIKKDHQVYGTSLLDITPTILSYFNIPVGENMKGKPILSAYEKLPEIKSIPSWELNNEGNPGLHADEIRSNPWAEREAMEQLIELGYIERPSADAEKAVQASKNEIDYYLARAYLHSHDAMHALPLLERLCNEDNKFRYQALLAHCYVELNRFEDCHLLLDKMQLHEESWIRSFTFYMRGKLAMSAFRGKLALAQFKKALELSPQSTEIQFQLASAYLGMTKTDEAEHYFRLVLRSDPRHVQALFGLGRCCYQKENYDEAIDHFLAAVEFKYLMLPAHYYLGLSLMKTGELQHAVDAFKTCIALSPRMLKPYLQLRKIYADELHDTEKLEEIISRIDSLQGNSILAVAGLPESGCREVYEVLNKQFVHHVELLQQPGERTIIPPEKWKSLNEESLLLLDPATLMQIPHGTRVRLIWVEKNWTELLKAQLEKSGQVTKNTTMTFPTRLDELNKNQMNILEQWLQNRPEIAKFKIDFEDFNKEREEATQEILSFLNEF